MKAIQISETGGPEVLTYVELPTPRPGPGEVLVEAHAIGVCMPETLVRKGTYRWMPPLPAIPGIEMSGTVVETGDGVTRLRKGQNVFVCAREFKERGGCYAEYLAAREDLIYALPDPLETLPALAPIVAELSCPLLLVREKPAAPPKRRP